MIVEYSCRDVVDSGFYTGYAKLAVRLLAATVGVISVYAIAAALVWTTFAGIFGLMQQAYQLGTTLP